MAARTAFLLAGYQLRVSEDWVVETVDIELAAHHAVIETSLLLSQEREFSGQRRRPGIGLFAQNSEAETALVRELTAHVSVCPSLKPTSAIGSDPLCASLAGYSAAECVTSNRGAQLPRTIGNRARIGNFGTGDRESKSPHFRERRPGSV